ncbi:ribosomal RNA small subunit methyltransferase A [bacterium]|jgi:16S rRNA (adenine1518-N6/adenine1519-N6)-dimethyltransferase|nr:ribosomal RNA small subunit methyltransferase A [bacterium]
MVVKTKGIALKKRHGQNFLRDVGVVSNIISGADVEPNASVLEIGCGDGFLTNAILSEKIERLWGFEIDDEWAEHIRKTISDKRFTLFEKDILEFDFSRLEQHSPWVLLANLPYHITFPILFMIQQFRHLFSHGVIMVQEEVAQKLVKTKGRGYGFNSLFFQRYFDLKLLEKISPEAFRPKPKVFSRLLFFSPKSKVAKIADEQEFWRFIKVCFQFPRRTLKNNLLQTHYDSSKIDDKILSLRSQQLSVEDFISLWNLIK